MKGVKARWMVLGVAFGLAASGCTSKTPSTVRSPTASPPPSGPQTFTVAVDGTSSQFSLAADSFFPNQLQVHPGDTVAFKEVDSGEPHTVTFGTLVDQAPATPASPSPSPRGSPPPVTLPNIFPATATGPTKGDAVPAAAQPCFLDTGIPPVAGACTSSQPALSGNQAFYNSGWLSPGTIFQVPLASTIAAGTYHFRCLVHPAMQGQIQVVAPSTAIPSPSKVLDSGASQLAGLIQSLAVTAQDVAAVTGTDVAGVAQVGVAGGFLAAFGPPTLAVKRFQQIAWTLYGQHALAINPPATAQGVLTRSPDGSVHLNAAVDTNTGGQKPPVGAQTRPVTVSGGTYAGSGFHNSGLLTSYPPGLITYTLSFSARGTYTLKCLIHPGMSASITVS